jgi:hypothetical protein
MRSNVRHFVGLAAALVMLGASPASAFPEAPGILQEELQLDCLPSCLVCHSRPEGGAGMFRPSAPAPLPGNRGWGSFVANLFAAGGGVPRDANQLVPFLVAFQKVPCGGPDNTLNTQAQACDSDGDMSPDLKELKEGTDPDVPDVKGPYSCVTPQYGCGASIEPLPRNESDQGHAVALIAALGVGLVLARRARR